MTRVISCFYDQLARSDECRTKKYFQYAENMIPLFLAILKFCSTKHLFKEVFN